MYWYYRQGPTATVCATRLTLGSKDDGVYRYLLRSTITRFTLLTLLTLLTDRFFSLNDHYSRLYFHIYKPYSGISIYPTLIVTFLTKDP